MRRRDFLKNSIGAGVVAGSGIALSPFANLMGKTPYRNADPDMVAILGGEPHLMFDRAIQEFGGMGAFVKKGQSVVVKPNIGWDATPERAANTNPILVKRIVEHCLSAGASEVFVFDHTCNEWTSCYKNSGIENMVKDTKGKIVPGNSERYYQDVAVGGKSLKSASVHELILESDVFINVPVLKNHGGAKMTISMKNLMGIVWDRRYWHQNDLHQCIADFASYRKPDLNIVDAYRVMKKNGPRGTSVNDVVTMKAQLISTDMVAVDTAATKMFGMDPANVPYIGLAENAGVGTSDLERLNISRLKL